MNIRPMLFIMLESSSGSIPSHPLTVDVIVFVGMNSISAIDFNCPSIASALGAMFNFHLGIKTKNYNRLTKFHKYLRPNESTMFTARFTIAIVFIPDSAAAANY